MTSARLTLAIALLLPAGVSAQLGAPPVAAPAAQIVVIAPTLEPVHSGFFFRTTIGPGYASANTDVGGSSFSVSGPGVSLRFGIGGYILPNIALYADLGGLGLPGPDVNYGGSSSTTSSSTTLVIAGVGLGFSYYVMPVNLYVGGALRAMQLSVDDGSGSTAKSDLGFGGSLVIGKEFWVSRRLSLGPALELEYSRIPDSGNTWSVFSAALTLSLTYN